MIGTKYTPGLLAALAETSHVRLMEIPTTPNGQWVSSFTKRYTDGWECKTTLFDADDAELVSTVVDCGADGSRFGFTLGHNVERVTVSPSSKGLSVSFIVGRWPEKVPDKQTIVLSTVSSVEFRSEVDAVSVIEETHSGTDKITSFFEDETSDDPWLVIVESD